MVTRVMHHSLFMPARLNNGIDSLLVWDNHACTCTTYRYACIISLFVSVPHCAVVEMDPELLLHVFAAADRCPEDLLRALGAKHGDTATTEAFAKSCRATSGTTSPSAPRSPAAASGTSARTWDAPE